MLDDEAIVGLSVFCGAVGSVVVCAFNLAKQASETV